MIVATEVISRGVALGLAPRCESGLLTLVVLRE